MISLALLALLLCNFAAIGLLPLLFFRRDGHYNLRWLATAAPFFLVPVTLLLGWVGAIDALPIFSGPFLVLAEFPAVILSAASIALIAMTVGTHRIPLALWHQDNDAPVELVTWGPYACVRHPFYTSFLLAFAAAALGFPHAVTLICLAYGMVAMSLTARAEERRLSTSRFGAAYREYMTGTGRFVPRILPRILQ